MIPGSSQFGNIAKHVGNYFGGIAQNVHDVGTAVGTNVMIGSHGGADAMQNHPLDKAGRNNLSNQIKEVGGAFLGKPGTRSDQYNTKSGYVSAKNLTK